MMGRDFFKEGRHTGLPLQESRQNSIDKVLPVNGVDLFRQKKSAGKRRYFFLNLKKFLSDLLSYLSRLAGGGIINYQIKLSTINHLSACYLEYEHC
jgi:hypothetical protein